MSAGNTVDRTQSLIPVVMAGIIAVYSLVISVLIAGDLQPPTVKRNSLFKFVERAGNDHKPMLTPV